MDNQDLWIVTTKSKALDGCTVPMDGSEFYYVECLVPAANIYDALSPIKETLLADKLELVDISKCARYVAEEWAKQVQFEEIEEAAEEALETGKLAYGLFLSSDYLRNTNNQQA